MTHRQTTATRRTALAAAGLAALLALPATAGDAPTLQARLARLHYVQGPAIDAVMDYRLDGWNYVDRTHIVMHAGPNRNYLITLMAPCQDLSTAENIAFTTTSSKLTRFDKLIVHSLHRTVHDCQITQIHELTRQR